jgi:hypothetical protein
MSVDFGGLVLEYVIIGFFSLVVGLVSLFIDPKSDKTKSWFVVGALILSASVTGAYGYYDSKDSKDKADKQLNISNELVTWDAKLEDHNKTIEEDLQTLVRRQNLPAREGDVITHPAAAAAPSAPASRPIIEYFAKDNEGDGVTKALRGAGLDVIKLPGQLPGPTNSLWAGNSVSIADVKPVALALLRAGVQLKTVRHFRDGSGPKDRVIEIGSDHDFAEAPVLTEEQIQNMTQLPTR